MHAGSRSEVTPYSEAVGLTMLNSRQVLIAGEGRDRRAP
jgi:hypothetical protein